LQLRTLHFGSSEEIVGSKLLDPTIPGAFSWALPGKKNRSPGERMGITYVPAQPSILQRPQQFCPVSLAHSFGDGRSSRFSSALSRLRALVASDLIILLSELAALSNAGMEGNAGVPIFPSASAENQPASFR
jgi:hypothetical protein